MSDLSSLPRFEEGDVPVVGGQIHYVAAGEGDRTLILLHKLGGWTSEFRGIMPILATRARTIAMDLPGHGGSTFVGDPPFIATQEEVSAAVMAALDTMGITSAAMIGSSAGGCVSVVSAGLWPERVEAVVSLGSALSGPSTRESARAAAAQAIADGYFDEDGNPMPRDPSYMKSVFGMSNPAHMEEMTLSRKAAGRIIQPASRGVGLFDYLSFMPRVEAPVLLAYGTRGGYGRFVEEASQILKNSRIQAIEDASAFPHQDKPEETAMAIMEFLSL